MTISRIGPEHQAAVIEMGISGFGEMRELARMARPTIALFTLIGHAHLEFLHDLEGVFRAKTEMLELMPEDGTVIVNGDDPWLAKIRCSQRLIRCGLGADCELRAENIRTLEDGTTGFDLVYWDGRFPVHIPAHGRHLIYAAMEAAAAGLTLGLSQDEIARGIAAYKVMGRRGALWTGTGINLVDDSYNANPQAMEEALKLLAVTPARRRAAVLGDMGELGELTVSAHRAIGVLTGELHLDSVIAIGEKARDIASAAPNARWYASVDDAMPVIRAAFTEGTAVLVKASHAMHFENIVKELEQS